MLIGISRVGTIEVGGFITPTAAPTAPVTPAYVQAYGRVVREYQIDRKIIARKKIMENGVAVKQLQKRASEVLDYDFDFTELLSANTDTVDEASVTVSPSGLNLVTTSEYSTIVKQWISGGTVGQTYSVLCTMTSALGRIKVLELQLAIIGE